LKGGLAQLSCRSRDQDPPRESAGGFLSRLCSGPARGADREAHTFIRRGLAARPSSREHRFFSPLCMFIASAFSMVPFSANLVHQDMMQNLAWNVLVILAMSECPSSYMGTAQRQGRHAAGRRVRRTNASCDAGILVFQGCVPTAIGGRRREGGKGRICPISASPSSANL
jgi:hypothetical protein